MTGPASSKHDPALTRRAFGAGALAAWAAGPVAAQTAATSTADSSSRVWLHYDQAGLDAAYDQSMWAANRLNVIRRESMNSRTALSKLPSRQVFSYGPGPDEKIEVFASTKPSAPINVFVHGGAWRAGKAADYTYIAENFVNNGINFAALDFTNVVEANGDMMVMAKQVRRALTWIARNARLFGGNPERIHVTGHSSGAHLAGVLLTTDWESEFNLPRSIIKSAVCVSGLYDLRAVRLSARSSYVAFTDEIESSLSPQRFIQRIAAPVTIIYGTLESPEFKRQSNEFHNALKQAGKPTSLTIAEDYNHFEICETLASPYGIAGRIALAQMSGP